MSTSKRLKSLVRVLTAVVVWFAAVALSTVVAPQGAAEVGSGGSSAGGSDAAESTAAGSGAAWSWPLDPQPAVERRFERPPTRYAAGHRGIDVTASAGQPVTAVADGVVTHSGVVAGRGTVTVRHRSGIASTYEPLDDRIETGASVEPGTVLGRIGAGSHCAAGPCLHLGARLGEEYLDPLLLLTRVRIVLLPLLTPPPDT